ncbi:hypothetical protein O1L60_43130 [Streptomyces diastatochromogenes]|nr:hypothetical protein [Streptomyces diastatochromogenes]
MDETYVKGFEVEGRWYYFAACSDCGWRDTWHAIGPATIYLVGLHLVAVFVWSAR